MTDTSEYYKSHHPSIGRVWEVLFDELKLAPSTGKKDDAVYTLCATLMLLVHRLYIQAEGRDLSLREIGESCKNLISEIVRCREEEDIPQDNEAIH